MIGFGAALSRQWKVAFRHPMIWLLLFVPLAAVAFCFLFYLLPLHQTAGAAPNERLPLLWTAAGVPVMLAFPAAVASLKGMASDWSGRRYRDLGTTDLRRGTATAAYLIAPLLTATLTALVSFVLLQAAIAWWTQTLPAARDVIFGCGYTMFGALHAAALSLLVVALLPSNGTYAAIAALSAVLPGLTFFPAAHAVSLARQTLMWQTLEQVFAGDGTGAGLYKQLFGVELTWAGQVIPPLWSLLLLTGTTLILLAAAIALAYRVSRAARHRPAPTARRA